VARSAFNAGLRPGVLHIHGEYVEVWILHGKVYHVRVQVSACIRGLDFLVKGVEAGPLFLRHLLQEGLGRVCRPAAVVFGVADLLRHFFLAAAAIFPFPAQIAHVKRKTRIEPAHQVPERACLQGGGFLPGGPDIVALKQADQHKVGPEQGDGFFRQFRIEGRPYARFAQVQDFNVMPRFAQLSLQNTHPGVFDVHAPTVGVGIADREHTEGITPFPGQFPVPDADGVDIDGITEIRRFILLFGEGGENEFQGLRQAGRAP